MKNWYEVIEPAQEIKEGNFDISVFAADLNQVWKGNASPDYQDPYRFFDKTYLTDGLQKLLDSVRKRLVSAEGNSIVNIQTPFGGGKTHSLIALYHYLEHGDELKTQLPEELAPVDANVCVLDGSALNARGNEVNGIDTNTLWGHIGVQLGGEEGYEFFRENDTSRTAPGSDDLTSFLSDHQPFVLLLDELTEYVNNAQSVEAGDTYLGSTTLAFCKQLTEAVSNLENGVILATLPASEMEDFGEGSVLPRLEKIFGRKESIETPVQDEEVYHIVRSRLFQDVLDEGELKETVNAYFEFYRSNKEQFPNEVRSESYRDKLERSYPFHPDLIDTLYRKWGTYSSFQRTRGLLQLLGLIVGDLYEREENTDLILPGLVNFDHAEIKRHFVKHIGEEYSSVIGTDIAGEGAKAKTIDDQKRLRHLSVRVSTSIFLHSFDASSEQTGATNAEIKLASLNADMEHSLVTDQLDKLEKNLWHLSTEGDKYYFSHLPNLNRMVNDKKNILKEGWKQKFNRLLQDNEVIGDNLNVIVWPNESKDIPDSKEIHLALLKPDDSYRDVKDWIHKRGQTKREYKNALIFSEVDEGGLNNLKENILEHMALKEIEAELQEDDAGPQKRKLMDEVEERRENLENGFLKDVLLVYRKFRTNDHEEDLGQPQGAKESLSHRYKRNLVSKEVIVNKLDARYIVDKLLSHEEELNTQHVRDHFYKDRQFPLPENISVLEECLRVGVKNSVFGVLYRDGDGKPDNLKFGTMDMQVPKWSDYEYLVTREKAEQLKEQFSSQESDDDSVTSGGDDDDEGVVKEIECYGVDEGPDRPDGVSGQDDVTRRVQLKLTEIPASKMPDVVRGITTPLQREADDVTISIDVSAKDEDEISESVLDTQVQETIRQLEDELDIEVHFEESSR